MDLLVTENDKIREVLDAQETGTYLLMGPYYDGSDTQGLVMQKLTGGFWEVVDRSLASSRYSSLVVANFLSLEKFSWSLS